MEMLRMKGKRKLLNEIKEADDITEYEMLCSYFGYPYWTCE